ncbi:MAG: ComF family protein [Actinobacteria bacterium]|nr:ComF family protein [Actinomycetota bacterium]
MNLRRCIEVVAPPLCAACAAAAGRIEPLCATCRAELRWLGDAVDVAELRLWAPVAYEGPARGLVTALKFRGAYRAAEAMASQIAANAPPGLLDGAHLVPVPLHPRRLRRRGFNQAELLGRALAERAGLPLSACLERVGPSATQVGRDRAKRLLAPAGTVRIRRGAKPPEKAILVDDVATTGGTLAACAGVLRDAGTAVMWAVAYARTPGR